MTPWVTTVPGWRRITAEEARGLKVGMKVGCGSYEPPNGLVIHTATIENILNGRPESGMYRNVVVRHDDASLVNPLDYFGCDLWVPADGPD